MGRQKSSKAMFMCDRINTNPLPLPDVVYIIGDPNESLSFRHSFLSAGISDTEKKGTFIILQVLSCLTTTVEYLDLSRRARMWCF